MQFQLTILGCGAATPTSRHKPTAQVVNVHDKYFLIDCGEGTQMQLRKYKVKMQRIQAIFISHLHGDHFFGLIGLLSTYNLLGRKTPLTIYGPPGLEEVIRLQFKVSESYFEYELNFVETQDKEKQLIFEDDTVRVYSFPLKHRVPCTGFVFEEKERKLNIEKWAIVEYKLQPSEILLLKKYKKILHLFFAHVSFLVQFLYYFVLVLRELQFLNFPNNYLMGLYQYGLR